MDRVGREFVREWFNGLDRELAASAARAATAQHSTMIGDQRELVFAKALREFLPPNVHVGSGKIFSLHEQPSKQIDVVLYDARFPVFKQGDSAFYPVEGVIATIEVKSTLTPEELKNAWINCISVMMLNPAIVKEDLDDLMRFHQDLGKSHEAAAHAVDRVLRPRTYIYAFDGMKQLQTFNQNLQGVFREEGVLVFANQAAIVPSVIATGGVVGIAWRDPFRIRPKEIPSPLPDDADIVLASFECDRRFGILASHLLWHIEQRTTLLERTAGVRRAVSSYLPFLEYIDGAIHDKQICFSLSSDGRGQADQSTCSVQRDK